MLDKPEEEVVELSSNNRDNQGGSQEGAQKDVAPSVVSVHSEDPQGALIDQALGTVEDEPSIEQLAKASTPQREANDKSNNGGQSADEDEGSENEDLSSSSNEVSEDSEGRCL
jgi:hypothetical protein